MYSVPSYYEMGSSGNSGKFIQGLVFSSSTGNSTTTAATNMGGSSISTAEEKAAAASKSHSEAERRRRKRINGHLATLRTLLPNTIKTDKASLLAEVVGRLRELKTTTAELAAANGSDTDTNTETNFQHNNIFPTEGDELNLSQSEGGDSATIKATLCCEDRPELISEITTAVRAAAGRVVRAEMATVGDRTKTILWVQLDKAVGGGCGSGGGDGVGRLRRGLKVVVERAGLGQVLPENKRARLSRY